MEKKFEFYYVRELEVQSQLAIYSFSSIGSTLKQLRAPGISWEDWEQLFRLVFREVHSFLTHVSNVSKLFWPEISSSVPKDEMKRARRQRTIDRGEHLRTLFHITLDSPLANRALRNHLEHFDERLDDFLHEAYSKGRSSVITGDMHIGEHIVTADNLDPKFILRHLDDVNAKLIFRGEEYELKKLADAVHQVLVASKELNSIGS